MSRSCSAVGAVLVSAALFTVTAAAADLTRSRDWGEPPTGEDWFLLGWMLHQERNFPAAIDAFAHALDSQYRTALSMYNIACGFALEEDRDHAFEWLDRAFAAGLSDPEIVTADSDLKALRSDPRWPRLEACAHAIAATRKDRSMTRAVAVRGSAVR